VPTFVKGEVLVDEDDLDAATDMMLTGSRCSLSRRRQDRWYALRMLKPRYWLERDRGG
jgi:hypothetical protein